MKTILDSLYTNTRSFVSKISILLILIAFPAFLSAQNVLFVVGDTLLDPGDQIIALSLQNQSGLSLEIKDDDGIQSSAANGKDLVLISSTTSAGKIGTTFTNTPTIVSCYNRELYDELGMVAPGGTGTVYENSIHLSDPATPWWLKLVPIQVTNSTHPFTYATINGNATMHSHVPGNSSQALSFTYPSGSQMYGMTAPADRVGLFIQDAYGSLIDLTTLGQSLLQASFGLTNPIQVNETKTFMGRYGVSGDAEYKILKKPSGGYMLIGSGQTPSQDWNFHVIELDDEGLQTGAHTLHTPDLQEDSESRFNMKTAAIATNGDIINTIEGRYWDGSAWAGCISPIIVRMDANRNVQFIKRLQLGCNFPTALRATSDNGFQLISSDRTQSFIHKFDAAGNVVWSKFMGMGMYLFRDMKLLSDGSAILVGSNSYETDPLLKNTSLQMVKINSSGNVLWAKDYDFNNSKIEAFGLDILANGNIAVTGQLGEAGNSDATVLLFDASGTQISGKSLDLGGSSMAYSLITHPDGGFVIGGGTRSHNFNGLEEPFIARYSDTGVMQWMQIYNQDIAPTDAKAMQFAMTADWGYLISAATGNTGFPGLIIKTDAQGKLRGTYGCKSEEITNAEISEQAISLTETVITKSTVDYTNYTFLSYTHTENTKPCVPEFPSACPIELPECPTVSLELMTPTTSKNYIATYTPRVAVALPAGANAKTELQKLNYAHELVQSVTYIDGLGRPIQKIASHAAANGGDIVSFMQYDELGREKKQFMPYESLGTYGAYQSNEESAQQSFYYSNFSDYGTTRLFSETQFEPSPLNRIVETAAPGVPWETKSTTGGSRETGEHTIINEYVVNDVDIVGWGVNPSIPATTLANYYPIGSLTAVSTIDENNVPSVVYTDKLGRTILTETVIESGIEATTYYIYDEFGRVRYVLQPEGYKAAKASSSLTQGMLDDFAFQYEYDERGRIARKKVPGGGWVENIYNKLGQLVFTQDANLAGSAKWLYTKYDAFSRPIETGIYSSSSSKSVLESQLNNTSSLFEIRQNSADGYSNNAFPTSSTEKLSITYYDDYDFNYDGAEDHERIVGTPNEAVVGFITGVKTKVLDSSPEKWLLTLTFFDDYGREIETRSEHIHGTDITKYQLNFIGEIETSILEHNGPNSTSIAQIREYCYDHNGRILRVTSQVNSDAPIVLAAYEFDVLGRQAVKKLHSKDGFSYLQNVDYSFNIRSWMTGINEVPTSDDLFEMSLNYNTNPVDIGSAGADMYNGNISGMSWKTILDSEKHGYSFSYDGLNRLEEAKYGEGSSYSINQTRYDVGLSYDRNGNILSLNRKGKNGASGFGNMDFLDYEYGEGNRLKKVTDNGHKPAIPDAEQFVDGSNDTEEYLYDANGNITEDKNKGIFVEYNHLNKPTLITKGTNTIAYVYDAAGTKLQQIVNDGSTKTNDYINGVQYENNAIQFFINEEGRLVPDGTIAEYRYEFKLNDHLGNVRVTFSDLDNNGAIQTSTEVLQTDHYYPFGMRMSLDAGSASTATPPNYYLYNGKEFQVDFALDWYDYGARMYDASIARWNGVDALAEDPNQIDKSPYAYVWNNPTNLIDPDGNNPLIPIFLIFEGLSLAQGTAIGATIGLGIFVNTNKDEVNNAIYTLTDGVNNGINTVTEEVRKLWDPLTIGSSEPDPPIGGPLIFSAEEPNPELGDDGRPVSPETDDEEETVSIWKAPQEGMAAKLMAPGGFNPINIPYHPNPAKGQNGNTYFAAPKDRALAELYARFYGEGIIELKFPKSVYDKHLKIHEQPYQGGPEDELEVPPSKFPILNTAKKIHHPR